VKLAQRRHTPTPAVAVTTPAPAVSVNDSLAAPASTVLESVIAPPHCQGSPWPRSPSALLRWKRVAVVEMFAARFAAPVVLNPPGAVIVPTAFLVNTAELVTATAPVAVKLLFTL